MEINSLSFLLYAPGKRHIKKEILMKKRFAFLELVVLLALIAIGMAACTMDSDDDTPSVTSSVTSLSGDFYYEYDPGVYITFGPGNACTAHEDGISETGTFVITGSNVTISIPGEGSLTFVIVSSTKLRDLDGNYWNKL